MHIGLDAAGFSAEHGRGNSSQHLLAAVGLMPSLAGQKLDKYDMLEEVGHGGMAVVYRGLDTVLDREVAVKVLHAHLADREESRLRLEREARTVAKLRHDNIVEIYDSSNPSSGEASYIVCEFIHGVTLRDWLDTRWVPRPVLAAMITHRLCLPLEHAHDLGIVHRDIKPENVMIRRDGCLKLMDFGIAQILDTQRLTTTGQLLGSPAYMAPELISGHPVDKRIDIFALGVMLYQLATNELPFAGRNPAQVLNRILEGDFKPPRLLNSKVDDDLAAIIAKALARDPKDRYQSASSLAHALEDYLVGLSIEPTPEELAAYFSDPEKYADDLDARVCRELMRQAARAMRDGHGARALRQLARVLEIEPDNKRAEAMLDKVRVRGQRMRQALFAGGAVALGGIVSAAVLLLQPDPPTPDQVDSAEFGVRRSSYGLVIPRVGPAPEPPEQLSDSETGGTGGETGDEDAGSDSGETGRNPTNNPPPRNTSVTCDLQVVDLPAALLAGGDYALNVPEIGVVPLGPKGRVSFDVSERTTVRLMGDSYAGSVVLDPSACKQGSSPTLRAAPRPADLKFQAGAIPLGSLIVSCAEGCSYETRTAKGFPPLNFPRGQTEMLVKLEFKAKDYRSRTKEFKLTPGKNTISISLEKIAD